MKYTLITLIALLSTCNLSSLPQDKGGKPISSKWMDWTMPSPPVVDSSTDKIDTVAITNHFYFITHNTNLVDTALQQLTSQCEQSFQTIKQFIGDQKNRAKIDYRIYPSIEQKALRTSKIDIAHLEKKSSTIHIVWNQYFQGNQLQQENKILLRQLLDRPLIAALEEGLSNHFTQNWYQEGYAYWGGYYIVLITCLP